MVDKSDRRLEARTRFLSGKLERDIVLHSVEGSRRDNVHGIKRAGR